MTDYLCEECSGPIIDGHHVVLSTFVVSVQDQQLANAKIYHEYCYRGPAQDDQFENYGADDEI
jgi:hypothetical protein